MANNPSQYPLELFVISDLHIGGAYGSQPGTRGFRINTHVDVLVRFIQELQVRAEVQATRIELVINGDFVDFLAETTDRDTGSSSFIASEQEARATFDAIARRDAALFDALRELLGAGVGLTIVLGNHDIELSLPAVRARFVELIASHTNSRFQIVYDGEAYVVGDVLIEHGNRYDGWNAVDYDRLRRFRSESSRKLTISPQARFVAPAGSQLVERIMNPIKQEYPFIDLLKPETDAALPLLLTLEPSFANIANGLQLLRLHAAARRHAPNSGAPARPAQPGDIAGGSGHGQVPLEDLHSVLQRRLTADAANELRQLIQQAADQQRVDERNVASGGASRALSFMQLRIGKSYESRLLILLDALRCLRDDKSFKRDEDIEREYLPAARQLAANGFSTVIFGHTHLAKDIGLPGGARYLNTGTWADLIPIPVAIMEGSTETGLAALRAFANAIRAKEFDDYLLFQPTFAQVELDAQGHATAAQVRDYQPGVLKPRDR